MFTEICTNGTITRSGGRQFVLVDSGKGAMSSSHSGLLTGL